MIQLMCSLSEHRGEWSGYLVKALLTSVLARSWRLRILGCPSRVIYRDASISVIHRDTSIPESSIESHLSRVIHRESSIKSHPSRIVHRVSRRVLIDVAPQSWSERRAGLRAWPIKGTKPFCSGVGLRVERWSMKLQRPESPPPGRVDQSWSTQAPSWLAIQRWRWSDRDCRLSSPQIQAPRSCQPSVASLLSCPLGAWKSSSHSFPSCGSCGRSSSSGLFEPRHTEPRCCELYWHGWLRSLRSDLVLSGAAPFPSEISCPSS